jgi:hypothetical protein
MTYADISERAALIRGLRDLANYLESDPEVPTPIYSDVLTFPPDGDWPVMCSEIDTIAARLGVTGLRTAGGHYAASRYFGPIGYRAVAIPRSHDDEQSR